MDGLRLLDTAEAMEVCLQELAALEAPSPEEWQQRQELVADHLERLNSNLDGHLGSVTARVFGSSLMGLAMAGSDVDIGLFGTYGINGVCVSQLGKQKKQFLLRAVMHKAILPAGIARDRVLPILGSRVPLLKYTCALSNLSCDLSLQDSGALAKAALLAPLQHCCEQLGPLYRVVKIWAAAHDINDASRGTLNSTSLLYMVVFFLQIRRLLPPLRELVDTAMLDDPRERLLNGANAAAWSSEEKLLQLRACTLRRAAKWAKQHGTAVDSAPLLDELLDDFWLLWAKAFERWGSGFDSNIYADLWEGDWQYGNLPHSYIVRIQDPCDFADCPARSLGSIDSSNGSGNCGANMARLIASIATDSIRVLRRHRKTCYVLGFPHDRTSEIRYELRRALAWLFGQAAVEASSALRVAIAAAGAAFVVRCRLPSPAPTTATTTPLFDQRQVRRVRQQALSLSPHELHHWMVKVLGAAVNEPGEEVLGPSDMAALKPRLREKDAGHVRGVPLEGGAELAASDPYLLRLRSQLAEQLQEAADKLPRPLHRCPPHALPRQLKRAGGQVMYSVFERVEELAAEVAHRQRQRLSDEWHLGVMALLKQHGVLTVLQRWGFLEPDGKLWSGLYEGKYCSRPHRSSYS